MPAAIYCIQRINLARGYAFLVGAIQINMIHYDIEILTPLCCNVDWPKIANIYLAGEFPGRMGGFKASLNVGSRKLLF